MWQHRPEAAFIFLFPGSELWTRPGVGLRLAQSRGGVLGGLHSSLEHTPFPADMLPSALLGVAGLRSFIPCWWSAVPYHRLLEAASSSLPCDLSQFSSSKPSRDSLKAAEMESFTTWHRDGRENPVMCDTYCISYQSARHRLSLYSQKGLDENELLLVGRICHRSFSRHTVRLEMTTKAVCGWVATFW